MRAALASIALSSTAALALAPDESIDKAVECLEAQQFDLARTYLDAVVTDERLTAAERSRAYYLRGYAFLSEGFDRSATADYAHALDDDPSNADALNALGELTLEGRGVERNDSRAFALFLRSARLGNVDAQAYVGYALLVGHGTARNLERARYWLKTAADAGHIDSLVNLARSYRAIHADRPDPERARAIYQSAVERGSSDALVGLGYMHLGGELGAPDARAAADYFARAARAGSAQGETALAELYLDGNGVDRDDAHARTLLERAAKAGYSPASARLAALYESGRGVARDTARARALYLEAAQQGDADAELKIASLCLARGDEASTREALRWLRAAADQDDPNAQNGLAWVLATTKHDALRNGAAAIAAAEQAVAAARSAATLDTLAAAYAEAGEFDRARDLERDALAALDRAHEHELSREFEARLAAYSARRPWRE